MQPTGHPRAIRIVLADDDPVARRGLEALLEAEDDLRVVASVDDVEAAIGATHDHGPDLLMLGLVAALDAVSAILRAAPRTRIAVLTMQHEPAFARQALGAGAYAYVLKDAADDELLTAVRRAAAGGMYLDPQLGARLATEAPDEHPPPDLSQRELEVLRMIAVGHTNAEIAERLYVSVRTVESHRSHIQHKLRRSSRADLVRYALERGLVEV